MVLCCSVMLALLDIAAVAVVAEDGGLHTVDELLQAVGDGESPDIVRRLLQQHPELVNGASPNGETPLHVSGIRGNVEVRMRRRMRAPLEH